MNFFYYQYNKQGIRVGKTVGGVETKFFLSGTKIIGSTTGSNLLEFIYLGNQAIGLWYNSSKYYYRRNIQGDVISLHEPNGSTVARYIYDAWGNHKVLDNNGVPLHTYDSLTLRNGCFLLFCDARLLLL